MRGSVFLRRTSFAAIPIPIKSSELKRSSAFCCEIPISFVLTGRSDQVNRIVNAHHTFTQHCSVNSQASLVAQRYCLQNHGRRRGSLRVQPNHHAALVFLYQLQGDFIPDLQLAPNQLVFVVWLFVVPAHIKVSTKSPCI